MDQACPANGGHYHPGGRHICERAPGGPARACSPSPQCSVRWGLSWSGFCPSRPASHLVPLSLRAWLMCPLGSVQACSEREAHPRLQGTVLAGPAPPRRQRPLIRLENVAITEVSSYNGESEAAFLLQGVVIVK